VTNQGKLRFMIYDGALNAGIFLKFLRRLIKDTTRKLFVIGNSQAPPRVSPIGNNGFLFSRPRLKLIACGAGT
jgi:hypothetical protein